MANAPGVSVGWSGSHQRPLSRSLPGTLVLAGGVQQRVPFTRELEERLLETIDRMQKPARVRYRAGSTLAGSPPPSVRLFRNVLGITGAQRCSGWRPR
jgi:hypothetical protein